MAWPEATDYNEAIQNPAVCFLDPELKQGRPEVNALGWPLPCSGNFAAVYKVFGPDGTPWAVKCFTREVPGLRERYHAISAHLRRAKLPFTVDFEYLEQGIRIHGNWYAVLKMRWVEGLTLNDFLKGQLDKPQLLERLSALWLKLARELRRAGIAHADLQHGNVLLVPGGKSGVLSVRLIDYDGMYVPALADRKSGEVGHANYQHPERARRGAYDAEIDRFPHLVIYTALRALLCGGRALWERHDNGENLLFRKQDFANPAQSPLFRELWQLPDPAVRGLTTHLARACEGSVANVPLLSELAETTNLRPPATAPHTVQVELPSGVAEVSWITPQPSLAASPASLLPQKNAPWVLGIALVLLGCLLLGVTALLLFIISDDTPVAKRHQPENAELRAEADPRPQQSLKAKGEGSERPKWKVAQILSIEESLQREREEAERRTQEALQRARAEAERQRQEAAEKQQQKEAERQRLEALKREREEAERQRLEKLKKRQQEATEKQERAAAEKRATDEADAARKLKQARGFIEESMRRQRSGRFDEATQLLTIAQRRLRDIIEAYQATAAAEVSRQLLKTYSREP